jgi:membrane protein implicated in regulation of membrane protease activity
MILYAICLVAGLLFTLASGLLGHLFGGHDSDVGTGGHAEAGAADSGMPGVAFFSPTVLASFVTAFGAFGLIFGKIEATSSVWLSAPLAALGGLVTALATLWFFNAVFQKTQSSSESRVGTLAGSSATIITPIPEHGTGEIAYVQAGSRYSAPARSENGQGIANGQTVRITRVVGTQFYVEAVS